MVTIVNKNKAYKIHYTIKNRKGEILEASADDEPLTFYPGDGSVLPIIEKAVVNATDNNTIQLTLLPKDAFGIYQSALIFKVNRSAFKSNEPLSIGQIIYANTPAGKRLVTISCITKNIITINANHELAGITLFVNITIIDTK